MTLNVNGAVNINVNLHVKIDFNVNIIFNGNEIPEKWPQLQKKNQHTQQKEEK